MNVEQDFRNLSSLLRCEHIIKEQTLDDKSYLFGIKITRIDIQPIIVCKLYPSDCSKQMKKMVKKMVYTEALRSLSTIKNPCDKEIPWKDLWNWSSIKRPICLFEKPPDAWFEKDQVLGIDWEGSPPNIAQIACRSGVYIDKVDSIYIREILNDERHTHCVFGEHEMHLVANPINLQPNINTSLSELVSLTFYPDTRFPKDKSIHKRVCWSSNNLSEEAINYAATDAVITLNLGLRILKQKNIITENLSENSTNNSL